MAYQIDRYNGQFLTVVEDGTINTVTDVKFVGKNYAGYGEIQNENFLHLLENFARSNPPEKPISGQIWFDSTDGAEKLKFFDGTQWKTTGGAEVSATEPVGLTDGDFWWDTVNEQLYAKGATGFVLVGPQGTGSGAITQMKSTSLLDTLTPAGSHDVILATVDDDVIAVISKDEFTIASTDAIPGFDVVRKGFTLINTESTEAGVSGESFQYHGTSSTAKALVDSNGVYLPSDFLRASQNGQIEFTDAGWVMGDDPIQKLKCFISGQQAKVVFDKNTTTSSIDFAVRLANNADIDAAKIVYSGINPGHNNSTLGTSLAPWLEVHADNFRGVADEAAGLSNPNNSSLKGVIEPTYTATPETVAARDINGDIFADVFHGVATQAQYADLAEKYTTEDEYAVGTVVAVCAHEEHEMALANVGAIVAGVISEKPAYLMNAEADGQAVALKGRVPVRVIGPVKKGEPVFVFQDGITSTDGQGEIVGVALEGNASPEEKLVECFLKV